MIDKYFSLDKYFNLPEGKRIENPKEESSNEDFREYTQPLQDLPIYSPEPIIALSKMESLLEFGEMNIN